MPELQIRVPYTAWGEGEEWEEGHEEVAGELWESVVSAGVGDADDPDHFDDVICIYLLGDDDDPLRHVARDVLARFDLLEAATAMVTDPDADDVDAGTPVAL